MARDDEEIEMNGQSAYQIKFKRARLGTSPYVHKIGTILITLLAIWIALIVSYFVIEYSWPNLIPHGKIELSIIIFIICFPSVLIVLVPNLIVKMARKNFEVAGIAPKDRQYSGLLLLYHPWGKVAYKYHERKTGVRRTYSETRINTFLKIYNILAITLILIFLFFACAALIYI